MPRRLAGWLASLLRAWRGLRSRRGKEACARKPVHARSRCAAAHAVLHALPAAFWKPQAYRRALDALVASGLPEAALLDLRGNHDAFNMPQRGGPNDFFARYAAEGRRSPAAKRAFSYFLPLPPRAGASQQPPGVQPAAGGSGGDAVAGEVEPRGRRLSGAGLQSEGWCPDVLLLGFDATPEPGLRSPANFAGECGWCRRGLAGSALAPPAGAHELPTETSAQALHRPARRSPQLPSLFPAAGVCSAALLREVQAELDSALAAVPAGCRRPAIVAYGHYPLSTIDAPLGMAGPLGLLSHMARSVRSMQVGEDGRSTQSCRGAAGACGLPRQGRHMHGSRCAYACGCAYASGSVSCSECKATKGAARFGRLTLAPCVHYLSRHTGHRPAASRLQRVSLSKRPPARSLWAAPAPHAPNSCRWLTMQGGCCTLRCMQCAVLRCAVLCHSAGDVILASSGDLRMGSPHHGPALCWARASAAAQPSCTRALPQPLRIPLLNSFALLPPCQCPDPAAGGYLAELETAAWKDDRRFRLLAVDRGALSFADLFFHTPDSPLRPRRTDALSIKENGELERGWVGGDGRGGQPVGCGGQLRCTVLCLSRSSSG